VLLGVVLAHPVILIAINPALLSLLDVRRAPWYMTAGTASLVSLLVLVAISAGRKRLKIEYDRWRVAHLLLAVAATGAGLAHVLAIGHYSGSPEVRVLWYVIGFSIAGVVFRVRVSKPWSLSRNPFRVSEVRADRGEVWVVSVEPDGHTGFSFRPGQFAWVSFRASPFAMREHPFSIASAPTASGRLEFAIKELGDFTRTMSRIEPGETCYVDGPYGAFTIDRYPDASGYVFIAGGIGIAPMVGMLRALADREDGRPLLLIAAHTLWDRVPLRNELTELTARLNLRVVHVIEQPIESGEGERGWIDADLLDRHLSPLAGGEEYFVCGPVPMIRAVERLLAERGVPASRLHTELFDLA
jgi:predicted ferric reductase